MKTIGGGGPPARAWAARPRAAARGRDTGHRIIYDELCRGIVREESRSQYRRIVGDLERAGADGVILGCTEIGLLFRYALAP